MSNISVPEIWSNSSNSSVVINSGPTAEEIERWYKLAWSISGVFAAAATVLSVYLILRHLRNWSIPSQQRCIVRILCMVPIYSIDSWLSIKFINYAVYFDIGRDCYEAYVLYQFFSLLIAYIEGDQPENLVKLLANKEIVGHPIPCCCLPHFKPSVYFFVRTKQCILQYVLVKPTMSLVAAILQIFGKYQEGNFKPIYGYLYVSIITNFSVTVAMYFLVLFYIVTKDALEPYNPISKFLCIKAILFFSFWQSVLIGALSFFDVIHEVGTWDTEEIARGLQDFVICIEMFLLALAHTFVFPYEPYMAEDHQHWWYSVEETKKAIKSVGNFRYAVNQTDIVADIKVYHPKEVSLAKKEHEKLKMGAVEESVSQNDD